MKSFLAYGSFTIIRITMGTSVLKSQVRFRSLLTAVYTNAELYGSNILIVATSFSWYFPVCTDGAGLLVVQSEELFWISIFTNKCCNLLLIGIWCVPLQNGYGVIFSRPLAFLVALYRSMDKSLHSFRQSRI